MSLCLTVTKRSANARAKQSISRPSPLHTQSAPETSRDTIVSQQPTASDTAQDSPMDDCEGDKPAPHSTRRASGYDEPWLRQGSSTVWDRYDPRSTDGRDRGDSGDRSRGGRVGATERARNDEPRDVFTKALDLPRGDRRELVRDRDRVYEINAADSRTLAAIGAFRVVAESDLNDPRDERQSSRETLKHLEREGLIQTAPLNSADRAVALTARGRELLEANREARNDRSHEPRQAFYSGVRKPRELTHDTAVYRAYQRAEGRIREQGGQVRRVVLDYELKRDYQQFLQERNRGRKDSDGRPDREPEEIARWAREHQLPYYDEQVHFPDARIEYEDRDGRLRHEDLEVVTGHYRGAHAAASARSGFTRYRVIGCTVGGRSGRRTPDPRLAEELLG